MQDYIRRSGTSAQTWRRWKSCYARMKIGPAMLMIESEWLTIAGRAPKRDGSSTVAIFIYLENVDEAVERAVDIPYAPDAESAGEGGDGLE